MKLAAPDFIDPQYDATTSTLRDIAERLLIPCCACINRVLDTLLHVGGSPLLPYVVPTDFWGLRVAYFTGSTPVGSFEVHKLHTVWWGRRTARMYQADADFRAHLADPDGLPIADDLLASAARKAASGDFRGAIIDAVCAVESAVGRYLTSALAQVAISNKKRKDFLGPSGISLAMRIGVLLPLLHEMDLPVDVLEAFGTSNSKRNRIVHRGERANAHEATHARAAASMLIDCLRGFSRVAEHWDGQSFRKPPPSI